MLHALWTCPALAVCRKALPLLKGLLVPYFGSFLDFLVYCHTCLSMADLELLLVFFWQVWFRRNRVVHADLILSPEDIVSWAAAFLAEFKAAVVSPGHSRPLLAACWLVPSLGWFKINSDAAFDVLVAPDVAEAMALLRGVQFVLEYGFLPFCCESDAASIVKQISSRVSSSSDVGLVVDDILSLIRPYLECSVLWANSVAHGLTKFALKLVSDCVLFDDVPSSVACLISKDIRISFCFWFFVYKVLFP
ncbi:hypothetical protein ACOSQ3_012758 [Xanthoceras sorbifolium]